MRTSARRKPALAMIALIGLSGLLGVMSWQSANARLAVVSAQTASRISESAFQQIRALINEKESRSPAQQKIDSQLLYALKMSRGENIAAGISRLEVAVKMDAEEKAVVDITAIIDDSLLEELRTAGAEIMSAFPQYHSLRAAVPLTQLEVIAAFPQVRFIQPKQEAMRSGKMPQNLHPVESATRPSPSTSFASRAARVRARLSEALPKLAQELNRNSKTSEGDTTHRAAAGRATFSVNGAGVRIGVISDGVSHLADSQASGDLPPNVTVLSGQDGSGDEGTALLEIIYDLAPGARLFFASNGDSIPAFARNIRDLRAAGCDIIVDDVRYVAETPFQDGQTAKVISTTNGALITQAVNDVTADGALYFSSAGNGGNKKGNQASTWEGDFADGGALSVAPGGTVHNFGGGLQYNTITFSNNDPIFASLPANLFWADPLGASSNDYDLFVLNSAGTSVVASSTNIQSGEQDPFEQVGRIVTNNRLVVLKKPGAANRFFHLTINRGQLAVTTEGAIRGHQIAANAFAVAATPAGSAFGSSPNPVGPFPNPFNAGNKVELFSSDGPRRIFFNADGNAITPSNLSSTGGLVRQKPDITAADGVTTNAPGFSTFYGTSAAAPHAAAIAALIKSGDRSLSPAQIRNALYSTAIDIEAPGIDRDSGAGIIMAFEALQFVGAVPSAFISSAGSTLTAENCLPANRAIDPGEVITLNLSLKNEGNLNTTNLVATLQATDGVTSPSGSQTYGLLNAGGPEVTRSFNFTASGACGGTLTATLSLQDGATSLGTVTFTFMLGAPKVVFSENFDSVTAPALPASWVSTVATGSASQWVTSTTSSDTAPNNAFVANPSTANDIRLDSPSIAIATASPQLSFRNNYDLEFSRSSGAGFDGGVLEIAIGASAFTDIVTAGGIFVTGGYNRTISSSFGNPLDGRRAWSGNSNGYITTIVNLPAAAAGQNIRLRWRMGSDTSGSATGWRIDTIKLTDGVVCATSCGGPLCPTITISPASLPAGALNAAYNQPLAASGAIAPYSFTLSAGTLPSGLTLSSTGVLSGTPTRGGSFSITIRATDANGCAGTLTYSLVINCPPITLSPATLPSGAVGTVYNQTITASPPGGNYTFAVTAGSLPGGLSLNSATGVITGAPTAAGTANFTITATGFGGCTGSRAYTLSIQTPCPTVTGINPSSGAVGGNVTITGTNFTGVMAVKFVNNVTASFNVVNNTTITAAVPRGAVSGPVTISKPNCPDAQTAPFTVISCTFTITPTSQTFSATGGTGSVNVMAPGGCAWTAVSNASFLTITSGASGSGKGTVSYSVAANTSATQRTGPIIIAGQTFTAMQAGSAEPGQTAELKVDDGSAEGGLLTDGRMMVNRLTPPTYPATLRSIRVLFLRFQDQPDPTGQPITLVYFTDPSGSGQPPVGMQITRINATVPGISSSNFFEFQIPNGPTINSGDFYVGYRAPSPHMGVGFTIDGNGQAQNRTFRSLDDGATFQGPITVQGFNAANALIRAMVSTGASCQTVSGLSTTSGAVGSSVTITGANFTGVNAVKFTNNVNASFTVNSDTQITTTVPSGAVTGPITISKPSCADAMTPAFTVVTSSSDVALTSGVPQTGSLPAPSTPNSCVVQLSQQYFIPVPGGATQLRITLSGNQDVDLFARVGQRITLDGGMPLFDYKSDSLSGNEEINVTPSSSPPLRAANYYIVVANCGPSAASFTVIATVTAGQPSLASVSAASFLGAELAAESVVASFGQNLATATQQASTIPLPTVLAGTTVEVTDSAGIRRPAPLFFVSSSQINYLIPPGVAAGPANVTIRSGAGAVSSGMIQISRVAPGLFSANSDGQGVAAAQIFRVRANGAQSFEPVARFDAAQQRFIPLPIDLGSETDQVFLVLYGTGIRLRSSLSAVTVSVGGANSQALFADAAPGFVGLDQVNSRLPRSLIGRGEVDVVLTVDGKVANMVRVSLK